MSPGSAPSTSTGGQRVHPGQIQGQARLRRERAGRLADVQGVAAQQLDHFPGPYRGRRRQVAVPAGVQDLAVAVHDPRPPGPATTSGEPEAATSIPPTAPPPAARVENAVAAAAPRAVCWIREPPPALPEWTKHITASLASCRGAASRGLARNSSTTGPPYPYHPAQPGPGENGGPRMSVTAQPRPS